MNQILNTKLKGDFENKQKNHPQFNLKEKKSWFRFQFIFSILIMSISILCGSFYLYQLARKEDFSNSLIANYNIYRLYQNNNSNELEEINTNETNSIFRSNSNT